MPGSPSHALARALRAAAAQDHDLDQAGIVLTNAVKVKLSQPGTGRLYVRTRNGVKAAHRASAPGQPPAVDTGTYRASWTWKTQQLTGSIYEALVYPDPAHLEQHHEPRELGLFLEFGTRHMAARPHLRPAVNESLGAIGQAAALGIVRRERGAT
jgi:hypothetical protein